MVIRSKPAHGCGVDPDHMSTLRSDFRYEIWSILDLSLEEQLELKSTVS